MEWTEEADNLLMSAWNGGKTLSQVAEAVEALTGTEVSRSAISGRKGRLIEMGYQLEVRETPERLKPFMMKHVRDRKVRPIPLPPLPPPVAFLPEPVAPVTHDNGVEYSRLGPRGCKALLDRRGKDGFWMCCGKLQYDGGVYCKEHDAQYYASHREKQAHG